MHSGIFCVASFKQEVCYPSVLASFQQVTQLLLLLPTNKIRNSKSINFIIKLIKLYCINVT